MVPTRHNYSSVRYTSIPKEQVKSNQYPPRYYEAYRKLALAFMACWYVYPGASWCVFLNKIFPKYIKNDFLI